MQLSVNLHFYYCYYDLGLRPVCGADRRKLQLNLALSHKKVEKRGKKKISRVTSLDKETKWRPNHADVIMCLFYVTIPPPNQYNLIHHLDKIDNKTSLS